MKAHRFRLNIMLECCTSYYSKGSNSMFVSVDVLFNRL